VEGYWAHKLVEGVDDSGWCETLMAIHGGDNALNGGQTQVVGNTPGAEERIFNPKHVSTNRACHHSIKIESRSNPETQISEVA